MMNPWILASLVFAGIGLLVEAVEHKARTDTAATPKKKKAKKPVPSTTIVNVPGVQLESTESAKEIPVQPPAEVPTDPPTTE